MPTNPNDYCEQTIYSRDVCSLMRRINTLEAKYILNLSLDTSFFTVSSGTVVGHPCCVNGKIYIPKCVSITTSTIEVYNIDTLEFIESWAIPYPGVCSIRFENDEFIVFCSKADPSQSTIVILDSSGTILRYYDISGTTQDKVTFGYSMDVYGGEIVILDPGSASYQGVKAYNVSDGSFIRFFATSGDTYICIDHDTGNYLITAAVNKIRVTSNTGTLIEWLGDNPGIYLTVPHGQAVFNDLVFVINLTTNRPLKVINKVTDLLIGSIDLVSTSSVSLGIAIYGNRCFIPFSDSTINCIRVVTFTSMTEFNAYRLWPYSESISLGTPDGGNAVPDDNALVDPWNEGGETGRQWTVAKILTDMRTAIESLVALGILKNPSTGVAYNWTYGDANNLYYCAMGDRTKYGAPDGARYTWTRDEAHMVSTYMFDIDIGEIYECIVALENADI